MFIDQQSFLQAFRDKIESLQNVGMEEASYLDKYEALGTMIREYVSKYWSATNKKYAKDNAKQVYYFSMEFLLGRLMAQNIMSLGIKDLLQEALKDVGIDLEQLEEQEPDAGLGNGGLGRLAACFLDSLASLNLPGHGCGIRYRYGLFEQKIIEGYQVELPENWLQEGNVWEIRRSNHAVEVKFGGAVSVQNSDGRLTFKHTGFESVMAVPYDMPVIGYLNGTVNTLRLWSAEPLSGGQWLTQSGGEGNQISNYWNSSKAISEFLYPDDSLPEGKILRLKQQYFLVSASLQSLVIRHKTIHGSVAGFDSKLAIHINDTHPVLAIPELMRILLDEEGLAWEDAWNITTNAISYTNHTTMVEALEKWSVDIFKPLLPRLFMIVEEINERFCQELWQTYPGQWDLISSMAILADGQVRMANLAIVGSHSVNGVSKLHTEILKKREMKNFANLYPNKFNNKTNGISHRRWLLHANPGLAGVVSNALGSNWIKHPEELKRLSRYAKDAAFQDDVRKVKDCNKNTLAKFIKDSCNVSIDPNSIMDVQVKRLHMYKRQLLNILNIMYMYNRILDDPNLDIIPRTFVFGAKSAPNYHLSKKVIKLINAVGSVVNNDKRVSDRIKVVFLENYRVTVAEKIIPAAEVSQQISTATKEASGTGNMKFMMNGAITLGTSDGANIEIMEEAGADNIFVFGLNPAEVYNYWQYGGYRAAEIYASDPRLRTVVDQLVNGFLPADKSEFEMIYKYLLDDNDEFFVLRDFSAYVDAQARIDQAYRNREKWTQMSIVNIAGSGKFSSDRTVAEYSDEIWGIKPLI